MPRRCRMSSKRKGERVGDKKGTRIEGDGYASPGKRLGGFDVSSRLWTASRDVRLRQRTWRPGVDVRYAE